MSRLIDEINKYKEAFKQKAPKEIQEMMLEATKKLENSSLSKKRTNCWLNCKRN